MDFVPCKNYGDVGHLKFPKMRWTTGFTQGYSHEREEKDENQSSMPLVFCGANIWKPFLLSKHGPVPKSRGILSSLKRSAEDLLGSIRAIRALKHNSPGFPPSLPACQWWVGHSLRGFLRNIFHSHKIQIWETWPASHKPLQPRLGSLLRGWMVIVIRHQEDDRKHIILLKICHFKNLEIL